LAEKNVAGTLGAGCAKLDHDRKKDTPTAMNMTLRIDFGRTRLRADEVARLRIGSVVALNELTTGPVELYAGGRLIAYGEAVEVGGRLAVRVVQLAGSQEENLRRACGALAREGAG
jgi:flagellar motor switch/type III secretory pathway protein FliN